MAQAIKVPPSKSIANRVLLLASLAHGESILHDFCLQQQAEDIQLIYGALCALNLRSAIKKGDLHITGPTQYAPSDTIQTGAAGTVLRFLLPLAALHSTVPVKFSGAKRLFERPIKPLLEALGSFGAEWQPETDGGTITPPVTRPYGMDIEIDGTSSSQFISGLAMAIAGLPGGGSLKWNKPPASYNYLTLTKHWLEHFRCIPDLRGNLFEIPGSSLKPLTTWIQGDWSAAAVFFCAAAIMGQQVTVFPLDPNDGQPDAEILAILEKAGSSWHFEGKHCHFEGRLDNSIRADLSNCPDLAPILTATATHAPDISEFRGLNTLPNKESDRLSGIIELIKWIGGSAEELPDFALKITPATKIKQHKASTSIKPFDTKDDHRMAFAAALGTLSNNGTILNQNCVSKSFPGFWEEWGKIVTSW